MHSKRVKLQCFALGFGTLAVSLMHTFKWDIALEPGNTKKAHHFFADGLVVSDKTKNAEAAWKFIKFMSSDPSVVSKRIEKGWSAPSSIR